MIPGRTILTAIQQQLGAMTAEQDTLSRQVYGAESRIQALVTERENGVARLARMYLPELTADATVTTLKEVQGAVQNCFHQKQARRRELEARILAAREQRGRDQAALEQWTQAMDQKAHEREKIEAEIAAQLHDDRTYQDARRIADQNQAALDSAKARAKAFESEAVNKLSAYESEPVFQYLVRTGYGTTTYSAGPIVRFGDNWAAGLVNFRESKRNYDRLKALPKFIAEEILRQQAALDKIVSELRRIEDTAAGEHGLPPVMADGKALLARRETAQKALENADAGMDRMTQELQGLDGPKDEFHRQALIQMKDFLRGQDIATLKARAREMPGAEDDLLVNRLEQIDGEISGLKKQAADLKDQQLRSHQRVVELSNVQNWYTSSGYDSGRSRFKPGFDVAGLLGGFLLGNVTGAILQSLIQQNHSYLPPHRYRRSDGYTASSSSGDSSWGSGGWSSIGSDNGGGSSGWGSSSSGGSSDFGGGGFSSSDSFGSGGSSTTDSF